MKETVRNKHSESIDSETLLESRKALLDILAEIIAEDIIKEQRGQEA